MKVSWKGSLTFGQVDIRVELYSAIEHHEFDFKLLHKKYHHAITYHRWCTYCDKEVAWSDIVKGIELADGSYFIMTPENLRKLKPEKTDVITVVECIDLDMIDPLLFNEHYYVLPSNIEQSFFLFATALADLDKVAIGTFVMRDKDHVCVMRPYQDVLLLTTLNYAYEIKTLPKMQMLKTPKLPAQELKLAEQLIKKLTKKKFDITQFKDTFMTELMKKVRKLKKGIALPKEEKIKKQKAESLRNALEASLGRKRKKRRSSGDK